MTETRNEQLVRLATTPTKDGVFLTYEALGARFGISRQRVHQLLQRFGVDRPRHRKPLPICGRAGCFERVPARGRRACAEHKGRLAERVTLTCCVCNVVFERPKREAMRSATQTRWFCSKKHQGKWLGLNFGRFPWNTGLDTRRPTHR